MHPCKITLKNYRCFEDAQPATIEVRPGFTALVGPNNSGKSSFLKFFYELRDLLPSLLDIDTRFHLARGEDIGAINFRGVGEFTEVFHNRNPRPLTIELEFPASAQGQISQVHLVIDRSRPNRVRGQFFCIYNGRHLKLAEAQSIPNTPREKYPFKTDIGDVVVDFTPLIELALAISGSMYVGAFRNTINTGSGNYYDLPVGDAFIKAWGNWKTGAGRSANLSAQDITNELERIFGFQRLEINETADRQDLQVIVDRMPYRLRELGSGLAQFLVVFAYIAITKPAFLLIDEPELNLHPSLQAGFLTSLAAYTTHGVMFATHSIGLARSTADRIYSFQKTDHTVTVRPFEQTPGYAEFIGEMSFSTFKEMGHDTILLTEGRHDIKTVQQFLRVLGKDHTVVVLPLGGNQLIHEDVEVELNEVKRLTNNVAVLIDSERDHKDAPLPPDRSAFVDLCKKLGFAVHATELRAIENYLTEQAVQQVKGDKYHALASYQKLADSQLAWGKHENWRIARVMTKDEILATDIGKFLAGMK